MEKVTKRFFSDAGHGWLSVKYKELVELGIENQITAYSYVNGQSAYLEEGKDMETYLNAQKSAGVTVEIDKRDHGEVSRIRKYDAFPSKIVSSETITSESEDDDVKNLFTDEVNENQVFA